MQKETIYSEEMKEMILSLLEMVMINFLVVMGMMSSQEKQVMINFLLLKVMT